MSAVRAIDAAFVPPLAANDNAALSATLIKMPVVSHNGLYCATQAKWGTTVLADNITYHPSGSVYQMNYGNGQDFTQTLNTRLLPDRLLATGGGVTALDLSYTYDQRAKITSIIDGAVSGNNRSYTYDALGQMKTATGPWGTQTNDYDTFGNILSREFMSGGALTRTIDLQYDAKNRVYNSVDSASVGSGFGNSGTGSRTVGYDSRGNVTTLGTMAFAYDYSDQPTVLTGSLGGTTFNSSSYTYDGNLKRVKSVINGRVIYNVYDNTGALIHVRKMAYGQEGEERSDYVKAAGKSIARLVRNGASGAHTAYFTFSDHLGSPVATMNGTTGVLETERYTPFGIAMDNPNALTDQAGFTGHIKDSATGLNYMQARYYDPVMGRFLSVDPVTFVDSGRPGQFNRYAYTWNDPINANDPDGEFLNFVAKFAVDVALEVAIQVASGEEIDLLAAGKGAAVGIVDPTKTARKIAKLGKIANATRKANKTCCFVAGTLVDTKDGLRPIEDIEVGDLVFSKDEETGVTDYKPVLGLIRLHDRVIWDLETVSETGEAHTFRTTDDHPWWVEGSGWKRTDELTPKDILATQTGEKVSVLSVTNTNLIEPTYNFEVADFNTYFVGESKVWVHNAACDVGLSGRGLKPSEGSRTIQGQVDNAVETAGGNVTVKRGGQDLVRVRSSGHGSSSATSTPQNVRNVAPSGKVFNQPGSDRSTSNRDMKELYKARTGQGTNEARTRGGKCINLGSCD